MTFTLQLIFETTKKTDLPDAKANIGLRHWTHEKNSPPLVTPNCVTIGEIRWHVKRLKKELDAIEARRLRHRLVAPRIPEKCPSSAASDIAWRRADERARSDRPSAIGWTWISASSEGLEVCWFRPL